MPKRRVDIIVCHQGADHKVGSIDLTTTLVQTEELGGDRFLEVRGAYKPSPATPQQFRVSGSVWRNLEHAMQTWPAEEVVRHFCWRHPVPQGVRVWGYTVFMDLDLEISSLALTGRVRVRSDVGEHPRLPTSRLSIRSELKCEGVVELREFDMSRGLFTGHWKVADGVSLVVTEYDELRLFVTTDARFREAYQQVERLKELGFQEDPFGWSLVPGPNGKAAMTRTMIWPGFIWSNPMPNPVEDPQEGDAA